MLRAAGCPTLLGLTVGLLLRALRQATASALRLSTHDDLVSSRAVRDRIVGGIVSDWPRVLVCALSVLPVRELAALRLTCKQCYSVSLLWTHHSKEWNRSWRKIVKTREEALCKLQSQVLDRLAAMGLAAAPNEHNSAAHKRLNRNLTHGANSGVLVDFSESDGRAAYTHTKMYSRGRLTSNVLMMNHPVLQWLRAQLLLNRTMCHAASVGGGPGFDLLSMAFLKLHFGLSCRLRVDVYDIEADWQHTVRAIGQNLRHTAETSFATCDIRKQLDTPENKAIVGTAHSVNIFLFNYVCVENATSMRENDFPFLRDVCATARAGSVIIFTDSADWLWPEVIELAGPKFLAFVVACQRSTPKHALVLVKELTADHTHSKLAQIAATSASQIIRAEGRRVRDATGEKCLYVNGGGTEVEERLVECSERSRMVAKRKEHLEIRLASGGERFD